MTLNLRVDAVNDVHVYCTLFIDECNCGKLVLGIGEYRAFSATLTLGAEQVEKKIKGTSSKPV